MVGGCQNIAVAKDLCQTHYMRQRRHGDVLATRPADWGAREKHPLYRVWNATMRYHRPTTCARWHDFWNMVSDLGDSRPSPKHLLKRKDDAEDLGPENFYWQNPRISGSSEEKKTKQREYMRAWSAQNADRLVSRELRKRYGITVDDYARMYQEQGGTCAICGGIETRVDHRTKKVSRLAVDHDHKTGDVRGLLCHHCNNALGSFDDDQDSLISSLLYLAKHSADPSAVLVTAISKLQGALPAAGTA